jgi:membrane-associated phospholipid phosphatase
VSALAILGGLGLAVTAYVALRTAQGERLDVAAQDAVSSPAEVLSRLYAGLGWVTVETVGLSLVACVALAVVRDRFDLALGALVIIGGANVTTQILKRLVLPDLKLSPGFNGLPSGHTTVALSIALAAVLVAPSAWRSMVAIGVSVTATLVGVALVLGRYHRPSDVIAAAFVCLGWAALGLLAAALVRRRWPAAVHDAPDPPGDPGDPGAHEDHEPPVPAASVGLGALIGASVVGGLLVSWGVRPKPGLDDLWLGVLSLGSIGLACAISIAAVARMADRHLA